MSAAIKTVFLLDDHSLYLNGLTLLIPELFPQTRIRTFTTVAAVKKAIEQTTRLDLLVSDIEIPGENTYEFLDWIKNKGWNIPILVISMHKKLAVIRKCKALGVEGYILKDDNNDLKPAICNLLKGGSYYSQRVESFYQKTIEQVGMLSPREEVIIEFISRGFSNNEIAEQLFISVETVKSHKKNIRKKLDAKTNHEIIQIAREKLIF